MSSGSSGFCVGSSSSSPGLTTGSSPTTGVSFKARVAIVITVANTTTTQTREYFFNYNENDQHTAENSALAGAVAEALVKDGFDYSSSLGTVKLVTDEGVTNDSDWSTARRFKVVFMNSTGIREFYIRTPNKTSISEIVQDIESGKIKTVEEKTVDFAGNTLEVYLANEAENA